MRRESTTDARRRLLVGAAIAVLIVGAGTALFVASGGTPWLMQTSRIAPKFHVPGEPQWDDGPSSHGALFLKRIPDGSGGVLLKRIDAEVWRAALNEMQASTRPRGPGQPPTLRTREIDALPGVIFRFDPAKGVVTAADDAAWSAATGPASRFKSTVRGDIAPFVRERDSSLWFRGAPVKLRGKYCKEPYLMPSKKYLVAVSSANHPGGGGGLLAPWLPGSSYNKPPFYCEVFRLSDGARLGPPVELWLQDPGVCYRAMDDSLIVFHVGNEACVVVTGLNAKHEVKNGTKSVSSD